MSTRWYPLYQRGNPQLRVFLPNFWMKLVKGRSDSDPRPIPSNQVNFIISMEMTRHDVKNYLKKIYNVDPISVHTEIRMGATKQDNNSSPVVKEDDYKVAYITLPDDQKFEFPELNPKEKVEAVKKDEEKHTEAIKHGLEKIKSRGTKCPDAPGWFV